MWMDDYNSTEVDDVTKNLIKIVKLIYNVPDNVVERWKRGDEAICALNAICHNEHNSDFYRDFNSLLNAASSAIEHIETEFRLHGIDITIDDESKYPLPEYMAVDNNWA